MASEDEQTIYLSKTSASTVRLEGRGQHWFLDLDDAREKWKIAAGNTTK